MQVIIFAALVAVAVAQSGQLLSSHHTQDPSGNYNFGFRVSDGTDREENQVFTGDNNVEGKYVFKDPEMVEHEVKYSSGPDGYKAEIIN